MKRNLILALLATIVGPATHRVLAAEGAEAPKAATTGEREKPNGENSDSQPAARSGATLQVGDPAPVLKPSAWIKGEAVEKIEPGKIYVLEFWATWCGPCIASIPKLTELQEKHAEVTVIGMNCMEQDASAVAKFVKKKGDKMQYRVAIDDAAGSMANAWLQAAGQDGLPAAFVVDKDSKIAWIGDPTELDVVVAQVVAGSFDAKKAAAEAKAKKLVQAELIRVAEANDLAAVDKLAKDHPQSIPPDMLAMVKLGVLQNKKDYVSMIALSRELCERYPDDAEILHLIALTMVDPDNPIVEPDLDLALKAAMRANKLREGENAEILDTLARVYFTRGDMDKAIEYQTQAVEKADIEINRIMARETLERYKAKQKGGGVAAPAVEGAAAEDNR